MVIHILESDVAIHLYNISETSYWTVRNIANGLNSLAICIEVASFTKFFRIISNVHFFQDGFLFFAYVVGLPGKRVQAK